MRNKNKTLTTLKLLLHPHVYKVDTEGCKAVLGAIADIRHRNLQQISNKHFLKTAVISMPKCSSYSDSMSF